MLLENGWTVCLNDIGTVMLRKKA
uniref:Uncharacterized protein n=1 Tax=Arundo donax TaxID=35708 RepID=A0A0A9SW62_ARUDO